MQNMLDGYDIYHYGRGLRIVYILLEEYLSNRILTTLGTSNMVIISSDRGPARHYKLLYYHDRLPTYSKKQPKAESKLRYPYGSENIPSLSLHSSTSESHCTD